MAESESILRSTTKRIAVVTGGNKGIGFETCKQLASNGVLVVLTARDVKRGNEAVEKLKQDGLVDVVFYPLDVTDGASIASLTGFMKTRFGKLDILVNNAAVAGYLIDPKDLKNLTLDTVDDYTGPNARSLKDFVKQTYDTVENCLRTNYYGIKQLTEALIPVLEQSNSPRIVNVSSSMGELKLIPNEKVRNELGDADGLTEEKVDKVVEEFFEDFKKDQVETKGWPINFSSYLVSKACLNAYTRVVAKKYPRIAINAVNPGYTRTDLNFNTGVLTVEEGAQGPVMLALMPDGGPSGLYFDRTEDVVTGGNKGIGFEICRQLASNGVLVVLTARDVNRGNEAVEKLKQEGLADVVLYPLEVTDGASIASLSGFMKTHFGKLDILVNNAGVIGYLIDPKDRKNLKLDVDDIAGPNAGSLQDFVKQTYDMVENCFRTYYYGIKLLTEALIPVLEQSNSPRIVNVSSSLGELKLKPNEKARNELGNADGLTEEKVDKVVEEFLEDFKKDQMETKGWPINFSAYFASKACLNAYTRVVAKMYPRIAINAVNPGYTSTDMNFNSGVLTVEEGAQGRVMLALMPDGGPSGLYFDRTEVSSF